VQLLDAYPTGQTEEVLQAVDICPVAAIDVYDEDGKSLT
jgi:ferredoxin